MYFSESYQKIDGRKNYKKNALDSVSSQGIFDNIKNNIYNIDKTDYKILNHYNYKKDQTSTNLSKNKQKDHFFIRSNNINNNNINNNNNNKGKDMCVNPPYEKNILYYINNKNLGRYKNSCDHPTVHNILKNNKSNIEIHQYIPSLTSTIFDLLYVNSNKIEKNIYPQQNNNKNMSHSQKFNEYIPMNGFRSIYHNNNMNNGNGYYTNTFNKQNSNLYTHQNNMYGRNNLMFDEDSIPYGMYDQSNITGTNTMTCGKNIPCDERMMYRYNTMEGVGPCHNIHPMINTRMNYSTPLSLPQYNPNIRNYLTHEGYPPQYYDYNSNLYSRNKRVLKQSYDADNIDNEKNHKKELSRKNISKIKKGDIDINIETSSSDKRGVVIDLNIGV
ncbi:hypothetical protein PFMALIP_04521 [Plasmodium falciparum MaliPS096_E11]|uniref:Uncharacterized protein n=1 Tax=Plasmodium falciparum MaliPS096_E11 TaxID=1036727 RepID=A0A024WLQ0_PLAFA|nr:hypothetical protein PFMALIP_04521 [Plasmodium falciparum MaliPS096_E11]